MSTSPVRGNLVETVEMALVLGEDGSFALRRSRSAAERVAAILGVACGERPLVLDYGWEGHLLPRISSEVERAVAGVLAERALQRWAPELRVERVDVEPERDGHIEVAVHGGAERLVLRVRLSRRDERAPQSESTR